MADINTNYSQFYAGTDRINHYGTGADKKAAVVRYEFHTPEEKGNQMSKEETMHAVNGITSQYGDDVIVEFSGDGMAALADHSLMMKLPEEYKEIPKDMVTHLERAKILTEEELAKMNERQGDDPEKIMKIADPDAYKEYQRISQEGRASGTQDGMVAGWRYMVKWYNKMAQTDHARLVSAVRQSRLEPDIKASTPKLSDKARKYLDSLRKQYGDYDFIIADSGEDRRSLLKQSNKEFSVVFSSAELERMARDEKYAAERMRRIQTVVHMTDRICQEFGYERAWGRNENKDNNGIINQMMLSLNDDGNMSIFTELAKSSEQQREYIEERLSSAFRLISNDYIHRMFS